MFNNSKARLSALMALTVTANLLAQPTLVSAEEVEADTPTTNQNEVTLAEQLAQTTSNSETTKVEVPAAIQEYTDENLSNLTAVESDSTATEQPAPVTVENKTDVESLNTQSDESSTITQETNEVITEEPAPTVGEAILTDATVTNTEVAPLAEPVVDTTTIATDEFSSEQALNTAQAELPSTQDTVTSQQATAEVQNATPTVETTTSDDASETIPTGIDASTITPATVAETTSAATSQNTTTSVAQDFIMPAYRYAEPSSSYWSSITAQGGQQIPYVIVNPSNGSGTERIENFSQQLEANSAAGIKSLGYVNTKDFSRSQSDVIAEVNRYVEFYGADNIDGIFFDVTEPGESDSEVAYMAGLYNYVKNTYPHMTVMGNPGRTVTNEIAPYADIWLTRETTADDYLNGYYEQISDMEKDPASSKRVMHLVHSANPADYDRIIALSRERNAGYLMVTDRSFLELPSNFDSLVSKINAGSTVSAGTTRHTPATPSTNTAGTITQTPKANATGPGSVSATPSVSQTPNRPLQTSAPKNNVSVIPMGGPSTTVRTSETLVASPVNGYRNNSVSTTPTSSSFNAAISTPSNSGTQVTVADDSSSSETVTSQNAATVQPENNTVSQNTQTQNTNNSATTNSSNNSTNNTTNSANKNTNTATTSSTNQTTTQPAVNQSAQESATGAGNILLDNAGVFAAIGGVGLVGAGIYVAAKKKPNA